MNTPQILIVVAAFLLGSVPFALVSSRLFGLADPRSYGSGNPGATNVLRTGNKAAAAVTLIGDCLKGLAAVLLAAWLARRLGAAPDTAAWAGLAAFLGHVFSIFLRFKGGKGVATALGVLLGFSPLLGVLALSTWLVTALVTRYSSLAALLAALTAPAYAWWLLGQGTTTSVVLLMSALLVWRHKSNVLKLLSGEETRIGAKGGADR